MSKNVATLALIVLGLAAHAWAQITAGDTSLNLSGGVSTGYSGSTTNEGPASHGIGFGGNADLSGSYHSPQFLNFNIAPFYNQSRNDSANQSITDSSGVNARVNLFGGSKFPGYVNFSDLYNSEGSFLVPGIGNYRTNGDTETLGVGWSFNPTNLPIFSVGYQEGNSAYSIYGLNNENHSRFDSIFAASSYVVAGFHLGGGVHHSDSSYALPQLAAGQGNETSHADNTTYDFSLSRGVALNGSTWINYSRNTTGYDALDFRGSETADVVVGGVSLIPRRTLSLSLGADYDDNLAGTVLAAANNGGAVVPLTLPGEQSHSWGVYGGAQYNPVDHLFFSGDVTHREQLFLGTSLNSTAYSGGVNYGRDLWGGQFTAGTMVNESSLGSTGGSRLGLFCNTIYLRQIGVWNVNGSFNYSRNAETLLVAYTTSGYSYTGSASRRVGRLNWNGAASGSQSMISEMQGTNTTSQSYSTALSSRRVGGGAAYSKSSGLGLYTAQGIATLPSGLPPTLLPLSVRYGGTTYSASLGGMPTRGLTFTGTFTKTRSNTENGSLSSNNESEEAYFYLRYKFRKVYFTAGYSRLVQGFSASTLAPAMVSTYYAGVSRWFNFF